MTAFGQSLQVLDASVTYDAGRVSVALDGVVREGLEAALSGAFVLDLDRPDA